jgi:UDPglucose 6-dehydrogenase
MRVVMIGTGYVGLVSGACLADFGHEVTCVDKDEAKIAHLHEGQMPIYEPGLDVLVARNVEAGRLSFAVDGSAAIGGADAVFIAVGTPASRRGDGYADLSFVYAAAEEIAPLLEDFTVIVTKSTVPVGTGDEIEAILRKARPDAQFAVVSNPEFLREGAAIEDFKRPDRVVVGFEDERARPVMAELYRPLNLNETPMLWTSRRSSELIKYAANAFLAMKITFINEVADLCEAVNADVQQVARGIGLDKRIGSKFLHAGPGYGGSCFPKDTMALVRTAQDAKAPLTLVEATAHANEARKKAMAGKVADALQGNLAGKVVGVLGLTFKPNTDDMRDAPSLQIVPALQAMGAKVQAYDPEGHEARQMLREVDFKNGPYEALEGADCAVIITEWDEFRALDLERVKDVMRRPLMVDLRNIYKPDELRPRGFTYVSVGRP